MADAIQEAIPALRLRLPVSVTEGGDLGGSSANSWVDEEGSAEARSYIHYAFNTASGYATRKEDYSSEGQAIRFAYDLSKSVYARKRQFALGAYAYVQSKSLSYSGELPTNVMAYLCGTNDCSPKVLPRSLSSTALAASSIWFDELTEDSYHPVSRQYLYPQPGLSGASLYKDTDYTFDAEVVFCGPAGSHPPYLDVAAEDVVPYAADAAPNGIFADRTADITLSWTLAYDKERYASFEGIDSQTSICGTVYGTLSQQAAKVRWTQDGGVTIHEIDVGVESTAVIPAGSITADSFQWQVLLCTDDGVWSTDTETWYSVPTDNDAISTAVALRPKNISIDGDGANTFYWEHVIDSGTLPTGADLQYSTDGGETWLTFQEYRGRESSCQVPASSLPAGSLLWRVRTYNASSVAGQWSDAVSLTVICAPAAPTLLSVGSTPLPEIRWLAEDQQAAEVEIDGVVQRVYGSQQSLIWQTVLDSGEHSLRIRTQNRFALWSKWVKTTVETINIPVADVTLHGEITGNTVHLRWTEPFSTVLLYRDEELLATLTDGETFYEDESSLGHCVYRLRGISKEGYYSDSNAVTLTLSVSQAVIGREGQWLTLKGRYEALPTHSIALRQLLTVRRYVGKTLPLLLATGQWEKQHDFAFSLRPEQQAELKLLQSWSGSSVIYKDSRGDCVCGTLEQVQSVHRGLYIDISFRISESAEQEGV